MRHQSFQMNISLSRSSQIQGFCSNDLRFKKKATKRLREMYPNTETVSLSWSQQLKNHGNK